MKTYHGFMVAGICIICAGVILLVGAHMNVEQRKAELKKLQQARVTKPEWMHKMETLFNKGKEVTDSLRMDTLIRFIEYAQKHQKAEIQQQAYYIKYLQTGKVKYYNLSSKYIDSMNYWYHMQKPLQRK